MLIREACAATRAIWGDPPPQGMVTFIDPLQVRAKRDPGRCYLRAGFRLVGERDGRPKGRRLLLVFQLAPQDFPDPVFPQGVAEVLCSTSV